MNLWSREVEGAFPQVFLTSSRMLLHYAEREAAERQKPTALLCLDHRGKELWSKRGRRVHASLPGERWLVGSAGSDHLEVLDADGQVQNTWPGRDPVEEAFRSGERLALRTMGGNVVLTDLELIPRESFRWPEEIDWADPACLVGDRFYRAQQGRVWSCDLQGQPELLYEVSTDLVGPALDAYREQRGELPFDGWEGDSPWLPQTWRIQRDPSADRLFLTHALVHMVLCLDLKGRPEWCRVFSRGCCAGAPVHLPEGGFVASAGCGQVLSWFDDQGRPWARSEPQPGSPYSNEVAVLSSGACLVAGGPGLLGFREGAVQHRFDGPVWRFAIREPEELLVMCLWNNTGNYTRSTFRLEARACPAL